MEFVTGAVKREEWDLCRVTAADSAGKEACVRGAVHTVRDLGSIVFILLRTRQGILQCVYEEKNPEDILLKERSLLAAPSQQEVGEERSPLAAPSQQEVGEERSLLAAPLLRELREEMAVEVRGTVVRNEHAPNGAELRLLGLRILSFPAEPLPVPVSKWKMNISLETGLNLRPVTLRNLRERAKFRLQEGIVRGFREYLAARGFTEIHTPKIGSKGAEGGANIFRLDYFHRPAVLAQSPQFYKQMMVGVFDRVFETGPVFRAEKHNTRRHLNEYTSLDLEMGYIDSFDEIMSMETGVLGHMMYVLKRDYDRELKLLGVTLPGTDSIPAVRFDEAKQLVAKEYKRDIRSPYDLEPEEEALIGRYFKERYDADFVFVTHYPGKKRPFYAMDDPEEPSVTLSFDCLFRGMEITTGGQRIHDYGMLLDKIKARDMSTEGLEAYLMAFRYGMPPHGGLGIGLERLTMMLAGEDNVRETTLFPRDLSRLEP